MDNLRNKIVEYLDENLGENSSAMFSFHPMRDAVYWLFFTTIKGVRYRFDYYYPFWEIREKQTRYEADTDDYWLEPDSEVTEKALDELKLVCGRAFGWRYAYMPPEVSGVEHIDINGERL